MNTDDISIRQAITIPAVIALAMLASAAIISSYTGVVGSDIFAPYLGAWASLTLISVLIWAFVDVAKMARAKVDQPLSRLPKSLAVQQRLFLLTA